MHLDLEGFGWGWGVGVGVGVGVVVGVGVGVGEGVGDEDCIEGLNDWGSGAEGLNWEDACQAQE